MAPKITKTVTDSEGKFKRERWYYLLLGIVIGVAAVEVGGLLRSVFSNPLAEEFKEADQYSDCIDRARAESKDWKTVCGATFEEFKQKQ